VHFNQLVLSGRIIEIDALRHTPAGLPVLAFRIGHASEQVEAGIRCQVQCEVAAMAMGSAASGAVGVKVGDSVKAQGFLARRSRNSQQLVMHVNNIEILERG
jgi:primosomal replication protein N